MARQEQIPYPPRFELCARLLHQRSRKKTRRVTAMSETSESEFAVEKQKEKLC